tara:strand:- start:1 stop:405 length:405 start_codon:yes stop_codon:yes gene_type:complete
MLKVKKGFKELVGEAEAKIKSMSPNEVDLKLKEVGVTLVDLRDIRELKREGTIPGSIHIPRGMLEFWIDAESPYYKSELDDAEELILFCNKGWRSALATFSLQSMGIQNVSHMTGGLEQWQKDVGRIEQIPTAK